MRRRSFRVLLASIFVLGCCTGALAFVSGSNAGSTGASLKLFAQPSVLTANKTGFIKASFTAASGSQTGSATHVMITVNLASGLVFDQAHSSANCTIPDPAGHPNDVVCTINSVSPGETVTRFVVFTAPSSPGPYVTNGSALWDNGSGGAGGGGAVNPPLPADGPVTTTVFAATDSSHAGDCFLSGSGTVSTPHVNADDNQSTSAQVGAAATFLGLPCPFADVGEDPAPPGSGFVTAISHDTIPQLTQPATITLSLDSMPSGNPFSRFTWLFSRDYPAVLPSETIPNCVNGQLPKNAIVCLLSKTKIGNGGSWTFLQLGTGGDPSFGH
jgi:hypothetical protein